MQKFSVLGNWSGTHPIHSHFHWHKTRQTNCNGARMDFMRWLMQEHPRATIQSKQDDRRVVNKLINKVLLQNCHSYLCFYSPACHFLLLILVWLSLCLCHMHHFSKWLYAYPKDIYLEAVSSVSVCTVPWKIKCNPEEPD